MSTGRHSALTAAARDLAVKILNACGAPGAGVALVGRDIGEIAFGVGRQRADTSDMVDADTLFAIGSLTKAFTAAACGRLVARGALFWDRPLIELRRLADEVDMSLLGDLTLRDILSGQTGLAHVDEIVLRTVTGERPLYLAAALRLPRRGIPRRAFTYSNAMFTLAGAVLEAVAAQPWDRVLSDLIWAPLGMHRTQAVGPEAPVSNAAWPHIPDADGRLGVLPWGWYGREVEQAAGAILSTPRDMARWLSAFVRPASTPPLSQDVRDSLLTPQVASPIDPSRGLFGLLPEGSMARDPDYGFGWFLQPYAGSILAHHSGGFGGFTSYAAMLPAQGLGVAVMLNARTRTRDANVLALALLGLLLRTGAERIAPQDDHAAACLAAWSQLQPEPSLLALDAAPVEMDTNAVEKRPLASFAGLFRNDVLPHEVQISVEGDGLCMHTGRLNAPLRPLGDDRFYLCVDGIMESPLEDVLRFRFADGRVRGVRSQRRVAWDDLVYYSL